MAMNKISIDWRPASAEAIATFLFVFLGPGVVVMTGNLSDGLDSSRLIAIAVGHGLAIALLVSATAHISGAHINPAVTVGALLTKRISVANGSAYIVAQLAGAALGALLLAVAIPEVLGGGIDNGAGTLGTHALNPEVSAGQGVLIEAVLTFTLVMVVFGAAMDKRGVGNLAPLAIGLAVLVDHLVGVPLTGASMNPARTFGPALVAGAWADHWVYWVGPLTGAALAAVGYKWWFQNNSND